MSRPIISLKSQSVEVAVWENTKDDRTSYQTKISRSYKDENGEWQKSEYLFPRDLPVVAQLLLLVWAQVAVKDRAQPAGEVITGGDSVAEGGVKKDDEEDVPF